MKKIIIGLWLMMFAWVFFVALPAKADHIPLEIGQTYTDRVVVCKNSNIKGFIKDFDQATQESATSAAINNDCDVGLQKGFVVEEYICSFVVEPGKFSVINPFKNSRFLEYAIVFMIPTDGWVDCTDEVLGEK